MNIKPAKKIPSGLPAATSAHRRDHRLRQMFRTAGKKMKAFIDGGSRGNPGPSAYGIVVFSLDGKSILWETSGRITRATCNQAEYFGLIALLERAAASDWQDIIIHSDSMLLVNQVNGRWRVKATHLQEMHSRAVTLLKKVRATIKWIPREKNEHADRLADQAMEGFE